jgi:hypothetical protein
MRILKVLLTILLVGSHFLLTGHVENLLHDWWPNERIVYELQMGLYFASTSSAAIIALACYIVWQLKMPKISLKRHQEIEEEEEEAPLPPGPLYGAETMKKFHLRVIKDTVTNYPSIKKELDLSSDPQATYGLIQERQSATINPKPDWV